jgi:DNA-binding NarL/FixJ family response regulator
MGGSKVGGAVWPLVMIVVASTQLRAAIHRCLLSAHACECLEAASGEEALGVVQVRAVDLLLIDAILPGMSAVETARRIRQLAPATHAVVLVEPHQRAAIAIEPQRGVASTLCKDALYDGLQAMMRSFVAGGSRHRV